MVFYVGLMIWVPVQMYNVRQWATLLTGNAFIMDCTSSLPSTIYPTWNSYADCKHNALWMATKTDHYAKFTR